MCPQDPYGRTPLHIAASVGAVRTCDGIVTATTSGINRTDVFGTTALDNARSKNQAAVEAIILAKGGLSGDDPRIQKEHEAAREFVENNMKRDREKRKEAILETLPEFKTRHKLACVEAALQKFMEVCPAVPILWPPPFICLGNWISARMWQSCVALWPCPFSR